MRTLAILAIVAVALTGCIPGLGRGSDNGGGQQPPTPEVVESDGFWRPNTLGEPLAKKVIKRPTDDGPAKARLEVVSLDSDGKSARMVAAWLPPTEGNFLEGSELQTELATVSDMPFVRLLDFKSQELLSSYEGEKLQYSDNFKNEPNPQPTGPDEFQSVEASFKTKQEESNVNGTWMFVSNRKSEKVAGVEIIGTSVPPAMIDGIRESLEYTP